MKKMKKKLTALMAAAAVTACTAAGCGAMTAATPSAFMEAVSGYEVQDQTEYCKTAFSGTEACYDALIDGTASIIEYASFTDDVSAEQYYQSAKNYVESRKGGSYSEKGSSRSTQGRYALTTDGMYYAVAWAGETALYASVDEAYKDTVKDIFKELGY